MPSSISDPAVSAMLENTRAGKVKLFPSPADWRDHWIYFLLIDRFNNPDKPRRDSRTARQAAASCPADDTAAR